MTAPQPQHDYPRLLAEDVWLVGNYFFNLYLVRGRSRSALIEVGVSATVDAVIAQLETLSTEPDYLIVTHPHGDHFTGLAGLRTRYPRARVVAGQGAAEGIPHSIEPK